MASYIKYWAYPATSVRCLTQAAGLASPSPLRFASPMGFGSSALLFCLCPSRPSAVLHFSLFLFLPTRSVPPRTIHSSPPPLLYTPLPVSFNSTFIIHIGCTTIAPSRLSTVSALGPPSPSPRPIQSPDSSPTTSHHTTTILPTSIGANLTRSSVPLQVPEHSTSLAIPRPCEARFDIPRPPTWRPSTRRRRS
jgi:hypothetical protein